MPSKKIVKNFDTDNLLITKEWQFTLVHGKCPSADIIKRSFNQLQTYENKLHLLTKARKREIIIQELLSKDDQEIKTLAGKLKELELGE